MKGLFVINSLEGGGAERVFCKLVELIDSDNSIDYEVEVALLDKHDEVYDLPLGVSVHRIGHANGKLIQLMMYLQLVFKSKPDFVLSFLPRANLYNVISRSVFRHKSIISERSNTHGRVAGRFRKLKKHLMLWMFKKTNLIIAVSQGVSNCLIDDFKVNAEKVVVLNNPYDLKKIHRLSQQEIKEKVLSEPYIVSMGRLVKTKGFDDLISSFAGLLTAHHLVILGQGPDLEKLEQLAADKGVADKVHFYGFLKNPYPIISNADVYVLPSYLEGFPNALVEAMALSKPVLSTNCKDGPADILVYDRAIENGGFVDAKYGIMVNTGDIVAAHKGLEKLLGSSKIQREYSVKSLERAKHFSQDNFYTEYKRILSNNILG